MVSSYKQLKDVFHRKGRDNMRTVNLLLNHYIGDDYSPSRRVSFLIAGDCLIDYLTETEDERTVEQFLRTYDSNESAAIYDYASDDGRIISENITYCNDFEEKYKEYVLQSQTILKEQYYWDNYRNICK